MYSQRRKRGVKLGWLRNFSEFGRQSLGMFTPAWRQRRGKGWHKEYDRTRLDQQRGSLIPQIRKQELAQLELHLFYQALLTRRPNKFPVPVAPTTVSVHIDTHARILTLKCLLLLRFLSGHAQSNTTNVRGHV